MLRSPTVVSRGGKHETYIGSDTVKSKLMAKNLVSNLHQLIKAEQADKIKMKQAD
jgi:hypothetical protein